MPGARVLEGGRVARDRRLSAKGWGRARLPFALLPTLGHSLGHSLGLSRVPDAPQVPTRDPWPGSPARGARMMRGELELGDRLVPLAPGGWPALAANPDPLVREAAHGFSWLRDLRAIGTDGARLRARALVAEWIARPPADPILRQPHVAARRIAAWLGQYDFFAASAEDEFRAALMRRLVLDARLLAAAMPLERASMQSLVALKGLIAAGVALLDSNGLLARAMRVLPIELERQILSDGGHVERSPSAQLGALRELVEMKLLLAAAGAAPPVALAACLDRMCPALRSFRHGDGGLALFNSSDEEEPTLVDLVLAQAGRGRAVHPSLAETGFERLAAGRAVLLMDTGIPAAPGVDMRAAAGTLGFELSIGRERMIVNCGAVAAPERWRTALRATAAHSTLTLADTSSSELRPDGLGRRPGKVPVMRQSNGGAHWLEASHDGWAKPFGAIHHRRLYLAETGDDLRGEDAIECDTDRPYAIRFHLHPLAEPTLDADAQSALIRLGSGSLWRLRADGAPLALEDSVYAGTGTRRKTRQIVLAAASAAVPQVRWAITRVA